MKSISLIIPAFNEQQNIQPLYAEINKVAEQLADKYAFELIFVNDGSTDNTLGEIEALAQKDERIKYLDFSRNFGKEIATTAGINSSQADACIMLDADLQHPVELIPEFIAKWEQGAEVVVGIRKKNKKAGFIKNLGSKLFYSLINKMSEIQIVPNATDFRLIDRVVMDEFRRFTETSRMTRALIDWLGFRRDYIRFEANERLHGTASYSIWKLFKLAMSSFISLSLVPLKLAGYLGIIITLSSGLLGFYALIGKYFLRSEAIMAQFTDAESLAILIVFLVGIILMSIGLMALYIANIHSEVINRPMYVVRRKKL